MRYLCLGSSKIEVSVVGLGTWPIGGWLWGGTDSREAIRTIHAALDSGINLIDTAPVYGFGRAEEIVGLAIKDRRHRVLIATKCGLVWHLQKGVHFFNADEQGFRDDDTEKSVYRNLDPRVIRYEVECSLRRLQVETIDLYQTHWPDNLTPIDDTMNELLALKKEGKIRAIGVCNAGVDEIDRYRKTGVVDTDQEKYNLLDRDCEKKHLPYCRKNSISFLAYSPLFLGLLSGTIGPEHEFSVGDQRNLMRRFSPAPRTEIQKRLAGLAAITQKYDCSIAQLAIAWILNHQGCIHVLAGARKPEHAMENARAADIVMEPSDAELIGSCLVGPVPTFLPETICRK